MSKTIIFIHGMFETSKSWESWIPFFEQHGYRCLAPDWPLHADEPAALRAGIPLGTGNLVLGDLLLTYERAIDSQSEPPILIGHSLGGLIVQVLVNRGKAEAGVAICPVAPNAMLSFDWHFLKSCVPILNPIMGDAPQIMTPDLFHETFANTLTAEESRAAWERFAVHESRNVLRSALGHDGHVDLKKAHAPLLLLSASEDHIIPASLVEKNADAYAKDSGVVGYHEFPGHGHFICGEPGWESVADFILGWIRNQQQITATTDLVAEMRL